MVSVKAIDDLLPQTQCGECGYAGCLPYAEALAQGTAAINLCPPGGAPTVRALGELLAINPAPFLASAEVNKRPPATAKIREAECIGCTKCIQACPVDAIIGSGKLMHAVIQHECTGCGLCIEPCPVDCIELTPVPAASYDKALARQRFNARQSRLLRQEQEKQQAYKEKRQLAAKTNDALQDIKAKQDYILQALARVQAKKNP
ncbi:MULTISPECIES: RnfABCDGE type electron transport complex subunit B [unclassified Legionella]|uniref:RnfABCDGE type electron transport complex subunit B n=1 Tax=unclassified Legionella TaxID=2622702 RepID=UPI0010553100|nr:MULTISPECIES: RnfABCDGE type electron transport complex subunit B [unclassified Legionella]MDI9819528.1 RnfABCDGE type electron transport complex subunit B [Legionella sp. PL877]